jgi:hypothetical protein
MMENFKHFSLSWMDDKSECARMYACKFDGVFGGNLLTCEPTVFDISSIFPQCTWKIRKTCKYTKAKREVLIPTFKTHDEKLDKVSM